MKHQQVVVDYGRMLNISVLCIVLVFFVWIFVKLLHAIVMLPSLMERNSRMIMKTMEKHGITEESLKDIDENAWKTLGNFEDPEEDQSEAKQEEQALEQGDNEDVVDEKPNLETKKIN